MKTIRTHHSHVENVECCPSGGDSMTEQSHAHRLNIQTMMTQGFIESTKKPLWGDFSNIPPLDVMLNNRIRLTRTYNALPERTKKLVGNVDEFMRALIRNDENELIDLGLLAKPSEPEPEVGTD